MQNVAEERRNGPSSDRANRLSETSAAGDRSLSRRLAGLRILVVDDDFSSREVLACALEMVGAEVTQASGAAGALKAINEATPDVLISDIAMPDLDGYDLIQRVRNHPMEQVRKTPALAITAFAGAERRRVLMAGFQELISKPVDLDYLVARIARLMSDQ